MVTGPGSEAGELDRYDAPNCPDIKCLGADPLNIKNFVFLHGYNVNGQQARGWQSEMFKRMFWSGSKARFWGVTWYGWYSQVDADPLIHFTANFYENVLNAFKTAEAFKNFLAASVPGEKIVAAHSLGNMVVSSAISDYNARIDKYFLINAAVALEAFKGKEAPSDDLIPSLWSPYNPRLRASEWYKLFKGQIPIDHREELTWRDRFAVMNNVMVYNFFSEGDEVVSNWWQLGERLKGSVPIASPYGGWAFNFADWGPIYPTLADQIDQTELRTKPFFDKGGLIAPLLTPGPPRFQPRLWQRE
ncbi:MAG: alpha/beta hydrolase [Nitrospirae bacterium]|nr:alpha/beta hydrolase [Nitrospirota bacterium]